MFKTYCLFDAFKLVSRFLTLVCVRRKCLEKTYTTQFYNICLLHKTPGTTTTPPAVSHHLVSTDTQSGGDGEKRNTLSIRKNKKTKHILMKQDLIRREERREIDKRILNCKLDYRGWVILIKSSVF